MEGAICASVRHPRRPITVKNTSAQEIEDARALIAVEIAAGYTSFAIDASFNPIPENARITTDLSAPIRECGLGEEGTYFAVWAPNAENVFVTGNFNGWNPTSSPLRSTGDSGHALTP